jgi:hypothetical protein
VIGKSIIKYNGLGSLTHICNSEVGVIRGKAFAIVGHKQWGKSKTLAALTDGNTHQRRCVIKSQEFFVRRMSNDDRPPSFYDRLDDLCPDRWPYVILALCPTFADKKRRSQLNRALHNFRKRYQLFFFVLRTDYYKQRRRISDEELDALSRFGKVKVFSDSKADPKKRARSLKMLISSSLKYS